MNTEQLIERIEKANYSQLSDISNNIAYKVGLGIISHKEYLDLEDIISAKRSKIESRSRIFLHIVFFSFSIAAILIIITSFITSL
jgi:hypothetical protein